MYNFSRLGYPKPFHYKYWMYYIKISSVDEPNELVSFTIDMTMNWQDSRIFWNPATYGNISYLFMNEKKIFIVFAQPFGASEIIDNRDEEHRTAQVFFNSQITSFFSGKITTVCKMDVRDFPFDIQTCYLRFCLPYYGAQEVQIRATIYSQVHHGLHDSAMIILVCSN